MNHKKTKIGISAFLILFTSPLVASAQDSGWDQFSEVVKAGNPVLIKTQKSGFEVTSDIVAESTPALLEKNPPAQNKSGFEGISDAVKYRPPLE